MKLNVLSMVFCGMVVLVFMIIYFYFYCFRCLPLT